MTATGPLRPEHFAALSRYRPFASDHRPRPLVWQLGIGADRTRPFRRALTVIPHGKIATSGAISATGRFPNGVITFGGFLNVSFESETQAFDPNDAYVWLHNWNYLFFFPPPTQLSAYLPTPLRSRLLSSRSGARLRHPHVICIDWRNGEFRGGRHPSDHRSWFPAEC